MKLFLLLVVVGVIMLVLRQVILRSPQKKSSVSRRKSRTGRSHGRDNTMHQSIGIKEATINPLSSSSKEKDDDRIEPTLVSTDALHEVRVAKEDVAIKAPLQSKEKTDVDKKQHNPDTIISLFVLAPKGDTFSGYELLQSILARGLRFGEDEIFHRHKNMNGTGIEFFRLAAATKQGTFDLPNMGAFSCAGLICYLDLDDCEEPVAAFEAMYTTAQGLAEDLHGDVLDQIKRPMNNDTLGLIRQHIEKYVLAERV